METISERIVNIAISIISLLLNVLLITKINNLNILPFKYLVIIICILLLINIISIIFIFINKKVFKIIGYILILLTMIFNCIACYYLKITNNFLDNNFKDEEVINDSFNIYIGGVDFTNEIYDFNMLVSIKDNKVLMTSIPRDYHIKIHNTDISDNIAYIGINDINEKTKSLEQLFDININYYIKINTNSLVNLVDMLGGIEYCSDIEYLTTHSMILDSYNDSLGNKLYVTKGCRSYNGIEILTIARERLKVGGDSVRQRNCRKIFISLIDKILSFESLSYYEELLNNLSNLYETNIPRDVITNIIKNIGNQVKYEIKEQEVNGNTTKGMVRKNTVYDYVMIPNYDSVEEASNNIKNILK